LGKMEAKEENLWGGKEKGGGERGTIQKGEVKRLNCSILWEGPTKKVKTHPGQGRRKEKVSHLGEGKKKLLNAKTLGKGRLRGHFPKPSAIVRRIQKQQESSGA